MKRAAIQISKICNDLRWMSSGPRCGVNEINLPPMQPGSSVIPGKVNPVIPEPFNQKGKPGRYAGAGEYDGSKGNPEIVFPPSPSRLRRASRFQC